MWSVQKFLVLVFKIGFLAAILIYSRGSMFMVACLFLVLGLGFGRSLFHRGRF